MEASKNGPVCPGDYKKMINCEENSCSFTHYSLS